MIIKPRLTVEKDTTIELNQTEKKQEEQQILTPYTATVQLANSIGNNCVVS